MYSKTVMKDSQDDHRRASEVVSFRVSEAARESAKPVVRDSDSSQFTETLDIPSKRLYADVVASGSLRTSTVTHVFRFPKATRVEYEKVSDSPDVTGSRAARASQDELSAVLEQLTVAARIVTAISLQNGLVDGTISPDDVTAELLNIGTAELGLLKDFDRKKVDDFVQKIKTMEASLDADAETLKIETMILLMDEWRVKYTDVGNLSDTSAIDSYVAEVENGKMLELSYLDDFVLGAEETLRILQKELPRLSTKNENVQAGTLTELGDHLMQLLKGLGNVPSMHAKLNKLKILTESKVSNGYPQGNFVGLLNDFFLRKNDIDVVNTSEYDKLLQLFSTVLTLVPDAKTSEGDLKAMEAVSTSRQQSHDRKFTSGFLNGYSDIGKLPSDTDNVKFKELIAGFDTDVLKTGLASLQSLMFQAAEVEKKWTGLSGESIQATEDTRKVSEKLIAFGTPPKKADLLRIDKCTFKPQTATGFYGEMKALVTNSTALPSHVDALASTSEQLSKVPLVTNTTDLSNLNAVIQFTSTDPVKRITEAPGIVAKVTNYPTAQIIDSLKVMIPVLGKLKKTKEDVSPLIQSFAGIKNALPTLVAASETKKYEEFYKCMKDLKDQFTSTFAAISLTQRLRKYIKTPGVTDDIVKLTIIIDDSRGPVDTLKKTTAAIRGKRDPEVKELSRLGTLSKESETFGLAVRAQSNLWKVTGKKAEFEKFVMDGKKVETAIEKVQDPKTKSELMVHWGDFPKVKAEISKLMVDLEAKRDKMVVPKTARFADFGPMFSGLSGMINANLDVVKARKVLDYLVSTNPDLAPLKILMDSLHPSDLQFSRFNVPLSKVVAVLPNIDGSFVRFRITPTSAPTRTGTTSGQMNRKQAFSISPVLQFHPTDSTTYLIISTTSGSILTVPNVFMGIGGVATVCVVGFACYKIVVVVKKWKRPAPILLKSSKRSARLPALNPIPTKMKEGPRPDPAPAAVPVPNNPQPVNNDGAVEEGHVPLPSSDESTQSDDSSTKKNGKRNRRKKDKKKKKKKKRKNAKTSQEWSHGTLVHSFELPKSQDQAHIYKQNDRTQYDYATWKKDHKRVNNTLNLDAWASHAGKGSINVNHTGYSDLKKWERDATRTAVQQWYDKKAEMKNPNQHSQPVTANFMEKTRGYSPNFNHFAEPKFENPDDFYNCNEIPYPLYSKAIVGEAPMDKQAEKEDDGVETTQESEDEQQVKLTAEEQAAIADRRFARSIRKKDTRPNFWKMVFVNKCPHIVLTCPDAETCYYYPKRKGEDVIHGDLNIKCLHETTRFGNKVERRVLLIRNVKTKKQHRVIHWSILGWEKGTAPKSLLEAIINVILATRLTKHPTCILSAAGSGRAGVLVLIEYLFQMLLDTRQQEARLETALDILRSHRFGIIENGRQLYFSLLAAFQLLLTDWKAWKLTNQRKKVQLPFDSKTLERNWEFYEHFTDLEWDQNKLDDQIIKTYGEPKPEKKSVDQLSQPTPSEAAVLARTQDGEENSSRQVTMDGFPPI